MNLLEDERQALLFRFTVGTSPKEAAAVVQYSMSDAIDDCEWMIKNKKAVARLEQVLAEAGTSSEEDTELLRQSLARNKMNTMFIKQLKRDAAKQRVTMLLMVGDAAIVDPAFVDLLTQAVRVERKKASEGVGFACHLTIDLKPSPRPITYRALVERVPGLGRSTVTGYLNWLLRERSALAKRTYDEPMPNGNTRQLRWHPKLDTQLQAGLTLKEDLAQGRISGAELISRRPTELDETDFTVTTKTLRISTRGLHEVLASAASRFNWVKKVKKWAVDNDYDEVLVKITPDNKGRTFSARFAASVNDAADIVYARTVDLVGFAKSLEQCPATINTELQTKLDGLLENKTYWR